MGTPRQGPHCGPDMAVDPPVLCDMWLDMRTSPIIYTYNRW